MGLAGYRGGAAFAADSKMRIEEKPERQHPWYLRPFFWNQKRKYGQVLMPALVWARVPRLFLAVAALYGVLDRRRSPLSPVLRSLVTVRVSQINRCRFCMDLNGAVLARRAGSMQKVEALERWKGSDLFDANERAVLEYTETVTYPDRSVSDGLMVFRGRRHRRTDRPHRVSESVEQVQLGAGHPGARVLPRDPKSGLKVPESKAVHQCGSGLAARYSDSVPHIVENR
jgi:AhpD family alkylhydroperoxidase